MKTIHRIMENFEIRYPLEKLCVPSSALFLDIETTGFTARSSTLYLIGCAFFKEGRWNSIQWFSENLSEQKDIILAFLDFAKDYQYLIHFNGNQFDLPYLAQKCDEFDIPCDFENFEGIDLYRRMSPYKKLFSLENFKQKSIEGFLGVLRDDTYSGRELIDVYQEYLQNPSEESAQLLLLHNYEDLLGMLSILPILTYRDVFDAPLKAKKVQANHYRDENDDHRMELIITVQLSTNVPKTVTLSHSGYYARLENAEGTIRVPVLETTLKYFYSNYKDYYYLPEEDLALHKSVASFVDKEHRVQASAQNCYTRKTSQYLRQWDVIFTPFFKKAYGDHELYFELTDERKRDRSAFAVYSSHILHMLLSQA